MNQTMKNVSNSDIYARINLLPMSQIERQVAINALRDAEAVVEAFVWVKDALARVFGGAALKPSLKH